ncbi:Na(+)/H(+) antiporter NhaA [Paraoerskovia sediminicola]|uniref:Na(+)/H(+) antiporter NhaA n=1 Tax=Paraoerskovia sediminicola TaxID=1138587 RepID=A0ABN6XB34_9CELL|nr:Na+/H+ antiporter NhaA [Paraoerskovia sediminicola]BDZ40980.1 Na(+)/H(+) antiporter NhaA [Paraoerskovia sediminicola]
MAEGVGHPVRRPHRGRDAVRHRASREISEQRAEHEPERRGGGAEVPLPGGDGVGPAVGRVRARTRNWVTRETIGGALLIGAAIIALVWANSPWRDAYFSLSEVTVGPEYIGSWYAHLNLSLADWAADGLLAIFFFVVGVELKHEFVAGSLRNPREAGVPMLAAVGGMALPAAVFAVVVLTMGDTTAIDGWAIPTATDIAFALAVLAVFGRGLPTAIRTFLLTLAVVDDLLAIIIIAIFYTEEIHWLYLGLSVLAVVVFGYFARRKTPHLWILIPLGVVAWVFMHSAGVHATIAGVLLGFMIPAVAIHGEHHPRTHRVEHEWRPISAGFALPVFAFFAAGISVVDAGGFGELVVQPVAIAIVAGLIFGKLIGVLGVTALLTRFTTLRLAPGIGVRDLLPVGFLAGIGFTVSLLIAELSFPGDSEHTDGAKVAVLIASLLAAVLAAFSLRSDAKRQRSDDMNLDGRPDDIHEFIGDDKDVKR